MSRFFKRGIACIPLILAVTGCSTPSHHISSVLAQQVELRRDSHVDVSSCQWRGEVTGSEGRWYSSIFYSNDTLAQGAINDIKNNAARLGADTVLLLSPLDFQTSVTLIGSAYQCQASIPVSS